MVVDASVAVAWYLDDNATANAVLTALESVDAFVPGNFFSEVLNALLKTERRSLIDATHVSRSLEHLRDLPLEVKLPSLATAASLARRHALTGYDAGYLALAAERGTMLATINTQLAAAAKAEKRLWMPSRRRR